MAEIRTKKQAISAAAKRISSPQRSNEELAASRLPLGPLGYSGLKSVSGYIFEEAKRELRWPTAGNTYRKMAYDSSVKSALNIFTILMGKVPWTVEAPEGASKESQEAASFLNYCMGNMEDNLSWENFINEVLSYLQYGFHASEKVFTQVKAGKWKGKYKWRKLSTMSQDTLYEWIFDDKNGDLIGVKQNPSIIGLSSPKGIVEIPRNKFLLFRFDPKRNNPEGNSPLKGCYVAWKYKTLIEDYEATGVSKDLGGIIEIGIDADYLAKATANPSGPEARVVDRLRKDAANLHAGDQAFVTRPIAYNEQGKDLFTFNLKGVDGGGKSYKTDEIIRRKQNEILTVFVADVLKLGQDGSGSFALSDNKNNQLTLAIQYHLNMIKSVLNNELIPQTLAINGWRFDSEEMPLFKYGDIDDRDLDIISKFVQRVVAVGAMSTDKDLDEALRSVANFPKANYSKPMPTNEANTSRSGDGMQEGMPSGTGKAVPKDDNSSKNKENAAKVIKKENGLATVEFNGKRFRIPEDDLEEFLGEIDEE